VEDALLERSSRIDVLDVIGIQTAVDAGLENSPAPVKVTRSEATTIGNEAKRLVGGVRLRHGTSEILILRNTA